MTAETRPAAEHVRATFLRRAGGWIARIAVGRTVALALAILSVASGIATYIVMTQSAPFGPDPVTVLILVNVDLALLLMLGVVLVVRFVGRAAARLGRFASARAAGRAVQLDRGDARHRGRGLLRHLFQCRHPVLVQ